MLIQFGPCIGTDRRPFQPHEWVVRQRHMSGLVGLETLLAEFFELCKIDIMWLKQ